MVARKESALRVLLRREIPYFLRDLHRAEIPLTPFGRVGRCAGLGPGAVREAEPTTNALDAAQLAFYAPRATYHPDRVGLSPLWMYFFGGVL